jgi:hypothetical protein
MQTKPILMFMAVMILVGTIVSMTTSNVFATQTGNSSNSNNNNINTSNCQEKDLAGDNVDGSATISTSSNDNGATDDADEPGDNDVNDDQEDTDSGNEDAGEANDQEQNDDAAASTSSNDNAAGANDQYPLPKFDPCNFGNQIIDNPYFTLIPGTTFTYQTKTEDGTEKDMVIVTNETKEILGITTTVVWDRVWLDEELTEETFDWHAQDKQGNVWYMGEDSKEYENGKVVSTEGSWEAGVDGAKPGIIMEANPQVGDSYRQEYYPGHAEDAAKVVSLNETVKVPFGTFTNCLQTKDVSLLEPTQDEDKYYCTSVGGVTLEVANDSGERTELIDFEQTNGTESTSSNDNSIPEIDFQQGGVTESTSSNDNGATDDADEPGDNDVNDDQEDTDSGNEDAGEANDDD